VFAMTKYENKMEKIARDIIQFLSAKYMWAGTDTIIFVNNKAIKPKSGISMDSFDFIVEDGVSPKTYIEYSNPETVTVSFDGSPLYEAINYGDYNPITDKYSWRTVDQLNDLIESHGYYYELGHAWNFTLYEI
jgi:hypothetical protein